MNLISVFFSFFYVFHLSLMSPPQQLVFEREKENFHTIQT